MWLCSSIPVVSSVQIDVLCGERNGGGEGHEVVSCPVYPVGWKSTKGSVEGRCETIVLLKQTRPHPSLDLDGWSLVHNIAENTHLSSLQVHGLVSLFTSPPPGPL